MKALQVVFFMPIFASEIKGFFLNQPGKNVVNGLFTGAQSGKE